MTKASTELTPREGRSTTSPSSGKPRRGRPSIPLSSEELLEMASLVLDASDGERGHYSAAGQIIARRYPEAHQEAQQARRKLMVRRFLAQKEQLLAEVITRRKPERQPVRAPCNSPMQRSRDIQEELRSHAAGIERITRLAEQSCVKLPAWSCSPASDRLARELNLSQISLGRQGLNPYGDDPTRSILQNAARDCVDPFLADLASGRSIAASMARLSINPTTVEFDKALARWETGNREVRASDAFSRWTKFR